MEIAIITVLGALIVTVSGWGYHIGNKIGKLNGNLGSIRDRLDSLEKRLNEVEHIVNKLLTGRGG